MHHVSCFSAVNGYVPCNTVHLIKVTCLTNLHLSTDLLENQSSSELCFSWMHLDFLPHPHTLMRLWGQSNMLTTSKMILYLFISATGQRLLCACFLFKIHLTLQYIHKSPYTFYFQLLKSWRHDTSLKDEQIFNKAIMTFKV